MGGADWMEESLGLLVVSQGSLCGSILALGLEVLQSRNAQQAIQDPTSRVSINTKGFQWRKQLF